MVAGSGMGNSVHLKEGSPEPAPVAKGVLRVYGMKFCPYVHRLKLVLAAKEVAHETININLKSKPKWYFAKNPQGKVPTIEIDGNVICESDITSEYVDAVYPGRKLTTTDALKATNEKMLLVYWGNKCVTNFYKYCMAKPDDKEAKDAALATLKEGLEYLATFLKKNGSVFICGSQPGLTDYFLYTHLERINAIVPVDLKQIPKVKTYFDQMQEDKAVKSCRFSDELHREFGRKAVAGDIGAYDIGPVAQ
uniref:glutathione S-transferase omega-1-like n=1 Tax=Ciona intestinalis TaxID=7719 RepID=UPI000180B1CD|nr:glutathione S-transferase omega-1-like [Ciona intestinalis]|eukprot:XP_009862082.1 glutathione S-transferase omega-1-like [Ciona intestinalis]